ncbi:molybdenum cofactor guanylyltransferase MobA [Piscinibacter gummiphilus]|uniref:Molybdenum cofactor guanylyltransferase n=1 Tax=Piscinibacter gummiphilus TaxID=946333 RepID=A0ABZ0CMW0_9BURK|nr:molybdenum cofactor guanylyltransferase MobA [Piscinibacter gummiphilus]WOB06318.1 molybdenum cofactor guanylyltransferase MobA [Piscinibacter gummiphilus]
MVERAEITGLVLAGGQGSRLGGVDKGLQMYRGQPLARTALERLSPQVGRVMLSANRHLDDYARWGVLVWPDPADLAGYQGPLAGFLSGLQHAETPYLVTVPCDCPQFPADLVARLAEAMHDGVDLVLARTDAGPEPAFCLMRRSLAADLRRYLESGERKVGRWMAQLRRAEVTFDDPAAFFNINTPDDLAR